jgi:hypothetical protein
LQSKKRNHVTPLFGWLGMDLIFIESDPLNP